MNMNTPDDILNELLDDDALDPKKLFNEKEYNTLIIDRGGFNKKENNTADLLEQLLDPNITRVESEGIYLQLKEMKAQKLLVNAIQKADRVEEKALLTSACWESGLEFAGDFLFFVDLACDENFKLAMEALTVVQYEEGNIEETVLKTALEMAQQTKSPNQELISDLKENINSRLN